MQTKKMSLANIKGKLSRTEMKNIMAAGSDTSCGTKGQVCPAPGAKYDGCCTSCDVQLSGTSYCK